MYQITHANTQKHTFSTQFNFAMDKAPPQKIPLRKATSLTIGKEPGAQNESVQLTLPIQA